MKQSLKLELFLELLGEQKLQTIDKTIIFYSFQAQHNLKTKLLKAIEETSQAKISLQSSVMPLSILPIAPSQSKKNKINCYDLFLDIEKSSYLQYLSQNKAAVVFCSGKQLLQLEKKINNKSNWIVVDLDRCATWQAFRLLSKILEPNSSEQKMDSLIQILKKKLIFPDLNQISALLDHLPLVKHHELSNLAEMIIEKSSGLALYSLTQSFLDKDMKSFFHLWFALKNTYPATFWTSFWLKKLWNIITFSALDKTEKNSQNARKFGLPRNISSLVIKDKSHQTHLQNMYQEFYFYDIHLKTGLKSSINEIIFCQHFLGFPNAKNNK